ncbi:MAG: mandelate racemase/muconate lactonizing enzyme family protein [Dehalococcoidia bacterium]
MPKNPPVISRIETFRHPDYARLIFVRLHTSDGLTGVGETSFGPDAVETFIHSEIADYLLGKDPMQLDLHWQSMNRLGSMQRSRGVEVRSQSAVDMALWDLYGKRVKQPLYQLLGGLSRDRVKVYNTCAGYSYGITRAGHVSPGDVDFRPDGPYEDQHAFMTDAGALAESLLSEGFTAMKIWPFDQFVSKTDGQSISLEDLEAGTEPFRKIRNAVGDRMEMMVEMHCLFNLPTAIRIAKSVEPLRPFWFEDPVPMDNIDALVQFKNSTHIATTASETVSTRWAFREMFEKRAMTICMFDISWVGGISEAKRIASMAEAYHLPIAPHDCVGPVTLMNSVHLSLNAPNGMIQEVVRAYLATWYPKIATRLPKIENGYVLPPEGEGVGMELTDAFTQGSDTTVQVSEL